MTTKKPVPKKHSNPYPGTSQRKDGSWRCTFDLPRHPDGSRNQKELNGFATQKEAFEAREAARVAARANGYLPSDNVTLGEFAKLWLRYSAGGRRPASTAAFRRSLARLPDAFLALPLNTITPGQVQRAYAELVTAGYALETIRSTRTALSMVCNAAVLQKIIPENPTTRVKIPVNRDVKSATVFDPENVWSKDETDRFLAATLEHSEHALWRFLLDSGLRIGEAQALTWDDIDGRIVRVRRTVTEDADGTLSIGRPKTDSSIRDLGLFTETVAHLKRYQTQQKARRLQCGPLWQDLNLVFDAGDGSLLTRDRAHYQLKTALKGIDVRPLTLHGMRHTMAVTWLKAGRSPAVVAARLGHANVAFTLDVYAKVTMEWQMSDVDAVEAFFNRTG